MIVPDWLPAQQDKEITYNLSLVNGVYQMHKQEVRGPYLAVPTRSYLVDCFCVRTRRAFYCKNKIMSTAVSSAFMYALPQPPWVVCNFHLVIS